ncbi:hypothetical protein K2X14_10770 [Acetobacter sp. TBRC 12305]|uniref:Uncharacterized protein n=1 Tax=Acetobacter garciniae TaxID=2817435 RepID=A0A939KNB4_9PROT|nr:hypothetical protein [Acetobacter garciniae]MBO1325510.1 hypothetical protein [Acetobacter garciniae]MBX0345318.1 hypothetical protein [Acetobacter garciniae]
MDHPPRYAVLFRTHVWDSFIERQFARLRQIVRHGDVHIVANNTAGTCPPVAGLPFMTFTESELEAMGLARGGEGEMLWNNVDYALYYFMKACPDYDYYILFEYDVMANIDLDAVMAKVLDDRADLVGTTKGPPLKNWWFRQTCADVYPEDDVVKMLLPLGIFSNRAVRFLFEKRLSMSARLPDGSARNWPHCEAFIPTELSLAGFKLAELSSYGAIERYSHEPAYLEDDVKTPAVDEFIHPVLDTSRYIASAIRYEGRPETYFIPGSPFRRKLARFPRGFYMPLLRDAFRRRFVSLNQKLRRLLAEWYGSVRSGRVPSIFH